MSVVGAPIIRNKFVAPKQINRYVNYVLCMYITLILAYISSSDSIGSQCRHSWRYAALYGASNKIRIDRPGSTELLNNEIDLDQANVQLFLIVDVFFAYINFNVEIFGNKWLINSTKYKTRELFQYHS